MARATSPFNWLLDGRSLNTASVLLARLIEERTPSAADVALAMVHLLPAGKRLMLVSRLFVQGLLALDFTVDELKAIWQAAVQNGAPSLLVDEQLARSRKVLEQMGGADELNLAEASERRGRIVELLIAAEMLAESELPAMLLADLEQHRCRSRAVQVAKVGRNDPCPCGSGRKQKRCCGG